MKRWTTKTYWLGFILLAVILHLILLLTVKRSFFSIFLNPIPQDAPPDRGAPFSPDAITDRGALFFPDAIITVPITLDEEAGERPVEQPVISEDAPRQEPLGGSLPSASSGPQHSVEDNLGGDDQTPLRSSGSLHAVRIPPRPVQIAWPDTRGLKKCLGESIELRMLVADDGRILEIKVADENSPYECAEAALSAARKIVFLPGLIDGKRAEMWTEIRIDFRDRP